MNTSILKLGFLVIIIGFANLTLAQRTCGTDDYWAQQLADNPKNVISRNALEQSIQQWIQANPTGSTKSAQKVVYTIPTVVHVVYNTGSQNISDAQVQSQIDVLNEDFRRNNADAANTPSWFVGVAADCEIEFCLAQQDPAGAASNGITRTSTGTTSFTGDAVKSTGSGGKTGWPRADYLNIWVCPLGGGLLGYATFPGGPASTDGVVIGYNYFGRIGTVSSPFDKGRTTTHEVGHWLALYHSFDGGCSGMSPGTCASNGDRCCDVPPTSSANYGCPSTNQNSCAENPDLNDMHMNYMDYTNDACMNLFTLDQKARMVSVMTGSRASLQSSQGCVNPVALALDAGISLIITPTGTSCSGTVTPVVDIENYGVNTLTSAIINYDVDGGANNTYSWSGSLTTGQSTNVTLPSITVSSGTHTFNSSTTSPNGGTDQDGSNDASSMTFTISSTGAGLPFTEGFEGGTFPPSGWVLDNPNSNQTFTRVTTASGFGGSSACTQMDFYSSPSTAGESDYLITKVLDLSGAGSPTVMDWSLAYATYAATYEDSLIIWASTDCGSSWSQIWQNGGIPMTTNGGGDEGTAWTPGNGQWSAESVNLDAFLGSSTVQIKFEALSDWGNNMYIDDINIYSTGAAPAPVANFNASSNSICVGEIITFSDQSSNAPTSWSWSFIGGSPASSTIQNPTVTYNIAGVYTVSLTATNGNGSSTYTETVTVGDNISVVMSVIDASCGACDGTATAVGTGGSGSYNYSWDTSPVQNTATATGLCPGSYFVSVTDVSTGCFGLMSTTVTSSGTVTASSSSNSTSCVGACDGQAMGSGANGASPYTYVWSTIPIQNSDNATGLCAGAYTVTVTDAAGCSTTSSVAVSEGPAMSVSGIGFATTCPDLCDGSATASASGTTPYNYSWNSVPPQSDSIATGLCAGTYSVSISDANGCIGTTSVTVTEPLAMILSSASVNASCGMADGNVSVSVTNGVSPYSYNWSDGQNTSTATGLAAGIMSVTVTDAIGCTQEGLASINNINAPVIIAISSDVTCNGDANGTASVTGTGGNLPYTYFWNNTATTDSIDSLSAGTYSVTVYGNDGCLSVDFVTITEPDPLITGMSFTLLSNNAACDGSATASVTGGTGPYTYQWNDPANQANVTATGLCFGPVSVVITDSQGCTSSGSINIVSVITSIFDVEAPLDVSVYPNPTSGEVNLQFKGMKGNDVEVIVFDLSGKLIIKELLRSNYSDAHSIDLSEYEDGIYFVKVIVANKQVITKKLSLIK